jgi:sarcosine oxidase subunit alpha
MFERTQPADDGVTVELDGKTIPARRGEPLAAALLAAGEIRLARSPKLHRPRGPSCLRGDCDGCLMRVSGAPNVTTCLHPVAGGEVVSTQNVLGTRRTDLLRVTDWFFPDGIDHHHLLVGVPGVSSMMTTFARKMAGLGKLPDAPLGERTARRVACDVLVVGGGGAGLDVASALAATGHAVTLVDEGLTLGGDQLSLGDAGRARIAAADLRQVAVLAPAVAVGWYGGEVLVVAADAPGGAVVVRPRALVLATGTHDGVLAVPNNDLPGVYSARASMRLHGLGITLRANAVLVGEGRFAAGVVAAVGDHLVRRLAVEEVASIEGGSAVRGVVTSAGTRIEAEAVLTDLPPAPAFELAVQAGAATRRGPAGFAVDVDASGRAAPGVWAIGGCTGASSTTTSARRLVAAIATWLSAPRGADTDIG